MLQVNVRFINYEETNNFRKGKPKPPEELVPDRFVKMVKCSLAKMAGAGLLEPDLIAHEFWRWFPKKMSNSKTYQKKVRNIKYIFYFYSLVLFFYF